jgi:Peptidase family M28
MLDPRIYRNGLMIVVVALIVLAFSLGSQAPPLTANLVPDAFNGPNAYGLMTSLAATYPDRRPGSDGDNGVADDVAHALRRDGFQINRTVFSAQTIDGPRTIQTVTGTLAGTTPGTIVVVAHRDSEHVGGAGSPADLSGTAVLLELGQVLGAQTQQRSIVLASTSAQVGAAGAQQLARSLPGPIDGVIVLGDMAGLEVRSPTIVPWSDSTLVASPLLRNTVAAALSQQTNLSTNDQSLGGQFLHLAFPLTTSEQRPFAASGEPAVLVSASGGRLPAANEPTSPAQITGLGRAVLESVSALEAGRPVPGPSSYLRWKGKLIPKWAVAVLVLALILPVLAATIDGLARARRRGHRVGRWIVWVLSACVPFVLAILAVLALHAAGVIDAPPGPVGGDALTLSAQAVEILAALACLITVGFVVRWRVGRRFWAAEPTPAEPTPAEPTKAETAPAVPASAETAPAGPAPAAPTPASPAPAEAPNGRHRGRRTGPDDITSPGAAAAFLLVLIAVTLAIWVENPFAAGLLVLALHCWMWILAPEQRLRTPWAVILFLVGLAPGVAAVIYYARAEGLGPVEAAWNAVLMLAGGSVSVLSAIAWSVVLGCVVSLAVMIVRIARLPPPRPSETPITVRGPGGPLITAGPGSLGRTRSTLRR